MPRPARDFGPTTGHGLFTGFLGPTGTEMGPARSCVERVVGRRNCANTARGLAQSPRMENRLENRRSIAVFGFRVRKRCRSQSRLGRPQARYRSNSKNASEPADLAAQRALEFADFRKRSANLVSVAGRRPDGKADDDRVTIDAACVEFAGSICRDRGRALETETASPHSTRMVVSRPQSRHRPERIEEAGRGLRNGGWASGMNATLHAANDRADFRSRAWRRHRGPRIGKRGPFPRRDIGLRSERCAVTRHRPRRPCQKTRRAHLAPDGISREATWATG